MSNEEINDFVRQFFCIHPDAKDSEKFAIDLWILKVCFKRAYEIGIIDCKMDIIKKIKEDTK